MKYVLETTPVREALQEATGCVLCHLHKKTERHLIRYFLGSSVMQSHVRIKVNQIGFCTHHLAALLEGGNRLGLALMVHTHVQELQKQLGKHPAVRQRQPQKQGKSASRRPNPLGRQPLKQQAKGLVQWLREKHSQCLICRRVQETMRHYAFTVTYLWDRDPEFRGQLLDSSGFCLPHLALTHEVASETLNSRRLESWLEEINPLQWKSLAVLAEQLQEFIRGYDYRSTGNQSEEVKTSLRRMIEKIAGPEPSK